MVHTVKDTVPKPRVKIAGFNNFGLTSENASLVQVRMKVGNLLYCFQNSFLLTSPCGHCFRLLTIFFNLVCIMLDKRSLKINFATSLNISDYM